MLLNSQEITEEIKGEIKKKSRNKWQWKQDNPKPGHAEKPVLRGKFIAIQSYPKKQANKNKQSNITLKSTKERTKQSQC